MIFCANPSAQFRSYQSEIEAAVLGVMRGSCYILGDEVRALEQEFANYIGTSEAIGVANGTDAIELALRSLDIGTGDEVITVSFTAVATVAAIEATGAIAVLVDVNSQDFTLNPEQLLEVRTPRTKAVIAVHLYGQSVVLDELMIFCADNNIALIEDASQAHGAKYKGKRLGSMGTIGCFSCYPTKNLGAIGDAGLVTTNDQVLAEKIRMLREYGWNQRVSEFPGRNSRLDEIQAAVLRVKLPFLDRDNDKRRKLAEFYTAQLSQFPITTPIIRDGNESVFHLYVVQVEKRDEILRYFDKKGIQLGIHYKLPVHLQSAYQGRLKTARSMTVTESLSKKILSLPLYPEFPLLDAEKVVQLFREFYS